MAKRRGEAVRLALVAGGAIGAQRLTMDDPGRDGPGEATTRVRFRLE